MLGFILIGGNSIGLCFYKHNRLWKLKAWSRRGGKKGTPDNGGMRGPWCWASPKLSSAFLSCLLPIRQLNSSRISFSHSFCNWGWPLGPFLMKKEKALTILGKIFCFLLRRIGTFLWQPDLHEKLNWGQNFTTMKQNHKDNTLSLAE